MGGRVLSTDQSERAESQGSCYGSVVLCFLWDTSLHYPVLALWIYAHLPRAGERSAKAGGELPGW